MELATLKNDLGETLSSKSRVTLMSLSTMEKIQVQSAPSVDTMPNAACYSISAPLQPSHYHGLKVIPQF